MARRPQIQVDLKSSRWRRLAACRETPTALFFPVGIYLGRIEEEQAKTLCSFCPVRTHCLTFAIEQDEAHGIWGGLNTDERRALTRAPRKTGKEAG